jgi:hypothetical protein
MPKVYESDLELDREVLFLLHQRKGKANAVPRWDFVGMVFGADVVIEPLRVNNNEYDRAVRKSIERWRSQGQHICNSGNGYFVANTRAEYEDFIESYISAAKRAFEIKSMMDTTADKRWGAKPKNVSPMQVSLL